MAAEAEPERTRGRPPSLLETFASGHLAQERENSINREDPILSLVLPPLPRRRAVSQVGSSHAPPLPNNPFPSWSISAVMQHLQPRTRAARTNFSAGPQPCRCSLLWQETKGFSNLLPAIKQPAPAVHGEQLGEVRPKHKQRGEGQEETIFTKGPPSSWSMMASNQQTETSLSSHSLLNPRSGHSPRGFASWAMLAAKGISAKGPILIIEKN